MLLSVCDRCFQGNFHVEVDVDRACGSPGIDRMYNTLNSSGDLTWTLVIHGTSAGRCGASDGTRDRGDSLEFSLNSGRASSCGAEEDFHRRTSGQACVY